jgi:AcrR family transcriptional regulator
MAVSSQQNRARGTLPRGPHHLTSEEVAEDQRRRLLDAMVELAGERGYAAIAVADVIARAGVSRKTFYAHFEERRDLLLAAFDDVAPSAFEEVREASKRTGGPTRQLEALMRRLCRIARERPDAIALSTIEIAAIHPEGVERRDRLIGDYGDLVDECLRGEDKQPALSPALPTALSRALAGAVHRTIDSHLRAGHSDEIPSLAPEFARWARVYHPVPEDFAARKAASPAWSCPASNGLVGGRAPGTLTLSPNGYEPPRETRSSGFLHHSNRERILDATAQIVAARGYTALTALSIAESADVSERAFLAHFKNKDEAFAAAVEVGHLKGQAIVERARAAASDWRTGVAHAVAALLELLSSEPYFTRLAFVDAPLAGPALTRRTHEHAGAYARLLLDGAPRRRRPPRIAPEAIVHGLFELAFHHAAQGTVPELRLATPDAVYLALAPFVGIADAAEAAA